MVRPNFLVIGAAKCGTTSMFHYLRQHPQVYMSDRKEVRFFTHEGEMPRYSGPGADSIYHNVVTDIAAYEELFAGASDVPARGEASNYLPFPEAAGRIKHHLPNVKLITLLRNPAERAFSNFTANRRDGFEPESDFARALALEPERRRRNWGSTWYYREQGLYFRHLSRYFELFDRENIKVYLTEDLQRESAALFRDVFEFLAIDDTFVPNTSTRYNVSGIPRAKTFYRMLAGPTAVNRLGKRLLPKTVRSALRARTIDRTVTRVPLPIEWPAALRQEYRQDILRLQDLIQRDLSAWLL